MSLQLEKIEITIKSNQIKWYTGAQFSVYAWERIRTLIIWRHFLIAISFKVEWCYCAWLVNTYLYMSHLLLRGYHNKSILSFHCCRTNIFMKKKKRLIFLSRNYEKTRIQFLFVFYSCNICKVICAFKCITEAGKGQGQVGVLLRLS